MKKILAVILLSSSLSGCITLSELAGGAGLLTTSIRNPIGLDQQYEIEATVAVARRTALAYFALPQCRRTQQATVANPCARRSIKLQIQDGDRKLNLVLKPFRQFVRENDTVNAASAAVAVWSVVKEFQASLAAAGVK